MHTEVQLEREKRYPITITYMKEWFPDRVLAQAHRRSRQEDLATLIAAGKYPWFRDDKGEWSIRNDVTYWETRISKEANGSGGPTYHNVQWKIHWTRSSLLAMSWVPIIRNQSF